MCQRVKRGCKISLDLYGLNPYRNAVSDVRSREKRKQSGHPPVEITLPAHVLMALDALAAMREMTRSAMVAQLVREEVRRVA